MRIHSWYVTLGIVGASAMAMVACTSTTTVNGTGDDASTSDSSTAEPDTGTDTGTTTPEPDSAAPIGDAGIVCEIDDGSDACDTCALTSCCAAENACQTETDGGTTDCPSVFSCVQDCLAPPANSGVDAGTLDSCTSLCEAGASAQVMADFSALSSCLVSSCSTRCN